MKKIAFVLLACIVQVSLLAQHTKTFEDGSVKTKTTKKDDQSTEQTHYFPSGSIRSKGIILNDIYTDFKAFDEDGTELASIFLNTEGIYEIKKNHTNGKPLQTLFYVKDSTRIHTYVPTGIWKSYNPSGKLLDEVEYHPKYRSTGQFKSGTSYYKDGSKKAVLTYNRRTSKFTFEQFYPSGAPYLKAIFDSYIMVAKYQNAVERTDLLSLLRNPVYINTYIHRRKDNITFYKYSYPNGKTAVYRKDDLIRHYRQDRTLLNSLEYSYVPKLAGYTLCTSDSQQEACKRFYKGSLTEREAYIPTKGKFIVKRDAILSNTRVYAFSGNKTGSVIYYGFNEVERKKLNYLNGKLHGDFIRRHSYTGEPAEKGVYKNGKKEGVFTTYSEMGIAEFVDTYADGVKHGISMSSGTVDSYWFSNYIKGVRMGNTYLKDVNTDEILIVGTYDKNGVKKGLWKKYNFDFEVYYPPSVLDYGIDFEKFENGQLILSIDYN